MHADLLYLMEAEELEKRDKMNDNIKIDFYGIDCKGVT
jgi:uncharacterized protein YuzE